MKKQMIGAACVLCLAAGLLSGCGGGSYKDGTYTAQSSVFEGLEDDEFADMGANGDGYGVVTITLKDQKIVDCRFTTYMPDGTEKDAEYGKRDGVIANQDYYNKAQRAVKASQNYADQLKAKGELKAVDAISGATISYGEFKEAVQLALQDAKK